MTNRTEKLSALLPDGCAALIEADFNRLYFTGFRSSDGYLLVTKNEAVFLTDSRYIEKAQSVVKCAEVKEFSSFSSVGDEIKRLGVKRLLMQSEETSVKESRRIRAELPFCEVVFDDTLDNIISALRSVKAPDEIDKIVRAQRIAESALSYVCGIIKEGITERQLGLELDFYMLKNGAEALSFETICVSGKNSSLPHGVPTDKKIEAGDFITMDFGAVVEGYHSDMTRTVAVKYVTDEQREVYETVLKAQTAAIAGIRAGISCSAADGFARKVIEDAGYGKFFRHSTGHGVGTLIHEAPALSPKNTAPLKAGTLVTVEPGIYIPDRFGVRIEDMVVVTETGCRNLTNASKELVIC